MRNPRANGGYLRTSCCSGGGVEKPVFSGFVDWPRASAGGAFPRDRCCEFVTRRGGLRSNTVSRRLASSRRPIDSTFSASLRRTLSGGINAIDALPISVAHAAHRHSISTQLTVSRLSRAQARAAQGQPLPPYTHTSTSSAAAATIKQPPCPSWTPSSRRRPAPRIPS